MRQRLDRAVQAGVELRDEHLPQNRAGVGLAADVAAGQLAAQLLDHRGGHHRAQVGDQQGVLDLLPGGFVEIAAAEQAEHAAAERVLGLGQAAAQPLQAAFRRRNGVDIGRGRRFWRGRRGFWESGVFSTTGGSGSRTSEIGRLIESRGIAASSPTPGRPTPVSVAVADDCVNVMPDEAV